MSATSPTARFCDGLGSDRFCDGSIKAEKSAVRYVQDGVKQRAAHTPKVEEEEGTGSGLTRLQS